MAQYFTDFSEYTASAEPSDWTKRWVTSNVTWEVREDGGATGGKLLFHEITGGAQRSALSWDAIDSDADRDDVEIVFKWRSTGSATSRMLGLARGSGTSSETGYVHGWSYGSYSGVAAQKYVSGTFTRFGEDAQSAIAANTWQITRLRISGTTHQVKHWLATDSEPGTWDVEATDSAISAAGWVGLMQFSNLPDYEVDWYGVGTNGDSAPMEAPTGGGSYSDSISLGISAGISMASLAAANDAVALGIQAGLSAASIAAAIDSLALGLAVGISNQGTAAALGAISVGVGIGLSISDGATQQVSESISLGVGLGITAASVAAAADGLTLSFDAGIGMAGQAAAQATISIGITADILAASQASVFDAIQLGVGLGTAIADSIGGVIPPAGRTIRVPAMGRTVSVSIRPRTVTVK